MRKCCRNHRPPNVLTPRALGATVIAFVLSAYMATPASSPRHSALVWNASASAPVGLYLVTRTRKPVHGDLVLVEPTRSLAAFAARRGYLPQGVPLVKRIAAVAGQTVCAHGNAIFVDGRIVSARLAADGRKRPLPQWVGCRTLQSGEVFLLIADVSTSFDGRYFGPTRTSQIAGTLEPLWTR